MLTVKVEVNGVVISETQIVKKEILARQSDGDDRGNLCEYEVTHMDRDRNDEDFLLRKLIFYARHYQHHGYEQLVIECMDGVRRRRAAMLDEKLTNGESQDIIDKEKF